MVLHKKKVNGRETVHAGERMMEKEIKARKTYKCSACGGQIEKGEMHTYGEYRAPVYSQDVMGKDIQDGIEYIKYRLCYRPDCAELKSDEVTLHNPNN